MPEMLEITNLKLMRDWTGSHHECVKIGTIGPLCPECNETTNPLEGD